MRSSPTSRISRATAAADETGEPRVGPPPGPDPTPPGTGRGGCSRARRSASRRRARTRSLRPEHVPGSTRCSPRERGRGAPEVDPRVIPVGANRQRRVLARVVLGVIVSEVEVGLAPSNTTTFRSGSCSIRPTSRRARDGRRRNRVDRRVVERHPAVAGTPTDRRSGASTTPTACGSLGRLPRPPVEMVLMAELLRIDLWSEADLLSREREGSDSVLPLGPRKLMCWLCAHVAPGGRGRLICGDSATLPRVSVPRRPVPPSCGGARSARA